MDMISPAAGVVRKYYLVLLIVLFTAGCAPSASRTTLVQPDAPLPSHLAQQPPAAWRAALMDSEVDFSAPVGDDAYLLATMQVTGFMQKWILVENQLVLLHRNTGELLWKVPRNQLPHIKQVVTTATAVILAGDDRTTYAPRITALGRSDGSMLWSITGAPGSSFRISNDNRLIVLVEPAGAALTVRTFALASGKELWNRTLPTTAAATDHAAFAVGYDAGVLLIHAQQTTRLDPQSGKILWQTARPHGLELGAAQICAGNSCYLSGAKLLVALDSGTGNQQWQFLTTDGALSAPIIDGHHLLLVEKSASGNILHRLNATSGRAVWKAPLTATVRSWPLLHAGKVYLSLGDAVYGYNLANGAPTLRAALPPFMAAYNGLPDVLTVHGSNIIVASEVGVAAFDMRNGNTRYAHAIEGGAGFNSRYLTKKYYLRRAAKSSGPERAAIYTQFTQTQIDLQQMRLLGRAPLPGEQVQYGSQNEALTAQTLAAAHLASSMVAVGAAFREEAVSASLDINRMQIDAAIVTQLRSLQHGYYIRPFYRDGMGVSLVRLSDGAWTNLYVSPANEPLWINSGNMPVLFVDTTTQRLLVKGLGLRAYPGETFEKVGMERNVFTSWPGIPPTWTIPYASLFAYNLNDLPFSSAERPLPPAVSGLAVREQTLQQAVFANDLEGARSLITQGAKINARDEDGFNALFYAAIVDDKDMVKMLIANGADATVRDPHDWLAYHYTFMTHAMNRTTGFIRDANLAQDKKR